MATITAEMARLSAIIDGAEKAVVVLEEHMLPVLVQGEPPNEPPMGAPGPSATRSPMLCNLEDCTNRVERLRLTIDRICARLTI